MTRSIRCTRPWIVVRAVPAACLCLLAIALAGCDADRTEGQSGVTVEPLTPSAIVAGSPVPTASAAPRAQAAVALTPTAPAAILQPTIVPLSTAAPTSVPQSTATVAPAPAVPALTPTPMAPPPPQPAPRSGNDGKPRPTSAAGLRVWSDGDSTSYFMSLSFLQTMSALDALPVQAAEYKQSTGLLNPAYFDWPAYAAAQMEAYRPDIAVFMIGANDASVGMPLEVYHQRVGAMMDLLYAPRRYVVWIGQPNMGRPDLLAAVPAMNEVFRQEAAARPWVLYVDAWAATSDSSGHYAQFLPDEHGVLTQMRTDDGVHFTAAGGRLLANAAIAELFGFR
jgi:hypothetical protein